MSGMLSSTCSHMGEPPGEPDPGQICWPGRGRQPAASPAVPGGAHAALGGLHLCQTLGQSWDCALTSHRSLLLSPDFLKAHVLVGQVDTLQLLLLILVPLPAINLLDAWSSLFDLLPELIRQPQDLGKSQRALAAKRHSRALQRPPCRPRHMPPALKAASCPPPCSGPQENLSQGKLLGVCPSQEASTTNPTARGKQL